MNIIMVALCAFISGVIVSELFKKFSAYKAEISIGACFFAILVIAIYG